MGEFWREKKLRFECQRCGRCCKSPEGFVFISTDDLEQLATRLNITNRALQRDWCTRFHKFIVLKNKPNGECIFYTEIDGEPRCKVYTARPMQCRTYPFWQQNLISPDSWAKEKLVCPGIGKGKVVSQDRIEEALKSGHSWLKQP